MEMMLSPPSRGHYAPAVKSKGMLYVSGQLPFNAEGQIVGDIAAQTMQVLMNLQHVLAGAGIGANAVVQCRLYIVDMADWEIVNRVYADFFAKHKPARTVVPCPTLHYNALIEIDAIAELP